MNILHSAFPTNADDEYSRQGRCMLYIRISPGTCKLGCDIQIYVLSITSEQMILEQLQLQSLASSSMISTDDTDLLTSSLPSKPHSQSSKRETVSESQSEMNISNGNNQSVEILVLADDQSEQCAHQTPDNIICERNGDNDECLLPLTSPFIIEEDICLDLDL